MTRSKQRSRSPVSRQTYSAPALEKGIDIVEVLADAEAGLTISEIARRLRRRMSELFRIIVVMERRGWLQKDPDTFRYSVTYHVLKLAHRGTPAQALSLAAAPVMHELSARINQSCHLVVRSGDRGLVILREENQRRHANLSVRLGATLDLAGSCSGRVLLACMDAEERAAVLRSRPRGTLAAALARISKRGYELQKSPMTVGVTDIGYPVRGFDGRVLAVLTVPYLHVIDASLPTTMDQARRELEAAAGRISQSLGWVRESAANTGTGVRRSP